MTHLFKNLFRFAGYSLAFLAVVLLCVHFWFKYNSERTIEQLVSWGSDGKLKCSIDKIQTDYFSNAIHIQGISIYTVNASKTATTYKFNVKDFHFRTRSRWDLFARRQLLIDSIVFNSPEILIGKRSGLKADSTQKIALLEDLEKLYSSIYKSLNVLNLQLFKINEGKLVVTNDDNPSKPPLVVNHIHFSIHKLKIGSSRVKDPSQFIFSEQVLLRIADQKIMLPDNKSNIAFKELLIDSKEKLVRLTDAAVRIFPSPRQQNSTAIKAGRLSITGLDFNTLYQKQLVKADSVFLEKPFISSELFVGGKVGKNGRSDKRALLDSVLNRLPVAFNIGHVVMQKGSMQMNLHQKGKITRLSAANDNVSIYGFHLNDTGKKELNIGGFRYTIRNYTGFLPDSLLQLKFDSLQFINDKIILHNLVASTPPDVKSRIIRNYVIPRFEITGMDWLTFIFHSNFKAADAVMYHPVLRSELNLSPGVPERKAKRSIYQNLSLMDKIIDLEKLRIIGGDVSLKQGNALELRLEDLNLSVHVSKLGKARSPDELVRSLKQLTFGKAAVTTPSVVVTTGSSVFDENGQKLVFDSIRVNTKNGDIGGVFKKVQVQDFSFENNQLDINSLMWDQGTVSMEAAEFGAATQTRSSRTLWFFIEKMSGNNTKLNFKGKNLTASVDLENLSANKISREKGSNLQTEGLRAKGRKASVSTAKGRFETGDFDILDKESSTIHDIAFQSEGLADSLSFYVPSLSLTPYLEKSLLTKTLTVDSIEIDHPVIKFSSRSNHPQDQPTGKSFKLPGLDIGKAAINQASLEVNIAGDSLLSSNISVSVKSIRGGKDSAVLSGQILVNADDLIFNEDNGKAAVTDFSAALDHFSYGPGLANWEMKLARFEADRIFLERDKAGKKILLAAHGTSIRDVAGSQSDFRQGISWFVNRSAAMVKLDSLKFQNEGSDINLAELEFNGRQHQVRMHSFSLNPLKSKTQFYEGRVYRKIYLSTKTGGIQLDGLQLKDQDLQIANAVIDSSVLNIYADKTKKFGPPMIQPLPIAALKKIDLPFQIDQIKLLNSSVYYTELSPVSNDSGSVHFSSVNAEISNVFSRPGMREDSLRVKASALFLNKIKLEASMRQSYQDTLSGLLLHINLGPGRLPMLNPFLAPLLSARVKSGYLDSMQMTASGNDYISKGIMNLRFRNLKAELLDSGRVDRRSFRSRLIDFAANTLAIKNRNAKKEASFTFVRNRQKPVIVYFLRMVVGGCAGSMAPVSNLFLRKQYKKAIQTVPIHARML